MAKYFVPFIHCLQKYRYRYHKKQCCGSGGFVPVPVLPESGIQIRDENFRIPDPAPFLVPVLFKTENLNYNCFKKRVPNRPERTRPDFFDLRVQEIDQNK
jgi:hypothetical protein